VFLEPQSGRSDDHDTNPEDSACLAKSSEPSKGLSTPCNTMPRDPELIPASSHDPHIDTPKHPEKGNGSRDNIATAVGLRQPPRSLTASPSVQCSRPLPEYPAPLQGTSRSSSSFPAMFSEPFRGCATRGMIELDPLVPGLGFLLCFDFTLPSPSSSRLLVSSPFYPIYSSCLILFPSRRSPPSVSTPQLVLAMQSFIPQSCIVIPFCVRNMGHHLFTSFLDLFLRKGGKKGKVSTFRSYVSNLYK